MIDGKFNGHPVWNSIVSIRTAFERFNEATKNLDAYDGNYKKLDYLEWILRQSDPAYVSESDMNAINSDLSNIQGYAGDSASNGGHFSHIENHFSSIFQRFPYPRIKKIFRSEANNILEEISSEGEELKQVVAAQQSSFVNEISGLSEMVRLQKEELLRLKGEADKMEALFATREDAWESKVVTGFQEKLAEWTSEISDYKGKRDEEVRAEIEKLRKDSASNLEASKSLRDEVNRERKKTIDAFEALSREQKAKADEVLKQIIGVYEQAGQIALSGGVVEASLQEGTLYEKNAWWAKCFYIMSALVLAIMWGLLVQKGHDDLSEIVMRLPISIVLLIPAAYFSTLAGKHRKTSVGLHSLGLRIKAFDAYLVNAEPMERQKLRSEMVSIFFDDEGRETNIKSINDTTIDKIVDRVGAVVEKMAEKIPTSRKD